MALSNRRADRVLRNKAAVRVFGILDKAGYSSREIAALVDKRDAWISGVRAGQCGVSLVTLRTLEKAALSAVLDQGQRCFDALSAHLERLQNDEVLENALAEDALLADTLNDGNLGA